MSQRVTPKRAKQLVAANIISGPFAYCVDCQPSGPQYQRLPLGLINGKLATTNCSNWCTNIQCNFASLLLALE